MFTKLRFFATLLTLLVSYAASAELAIIGHPDDDIGKIDAERVKKLFLGERKSFPNGLHAVPFNHVSGSPDRKEFFSVVLSMAESNHQRHWSRKMATGTGSSPDEVSSHEAILKSISTTPGSIGYIDASKVDDTVKVLLTIRDFDEV
jgi:ABC-type phosphate transport system substrate-binding protein